MRSQRHRRSWNRTEREVFYSEARRAPPRFTATAEGFVYDHQTERYVRGVYDLATSDALQVRFFFAYLCGEATSQTALQDRDRARRRTVRATEERDRWSPVRAELLGNDELRLVLAHDGGSRLEFVVRLADRKLTERWAGFAADVQHPTILLKEPTNLDDVRSVARDAIRRALAFLDRFDPYGRQFIETEWSARHGD